MSDPAWRRLRTALPLVLAAACWGLGTVVSKRAVAEVPTVSLLAVQLAASVVVLTSLMRWRGIALRDPATPSILLRLGLLNPGVAYGFSLLGLLSISASLSVLLWALEPVLILILAAFLLRERVGIVVIGLSGLAIVGLAIIAAPALEGTAPGVALTVAGVVCCAFYTIVTRRFIGASDSTAQVVLGQQAYALVLALGLAVVGGVANAALHLGLDRAFGLGSPSVVGIASALGSGVLYYSAAYWFYLSSLRRVPAPIAAASFYLVPVFGVAGGFGLLGDALSAWQWGGVGITALAVVTILGLTVARVPRLAPSPGVETA